MNLRRADRGRITRVRVTELIDQEWTSFCLSSFCTHPEVDISITSLHNNQVLLLVDTLLCLFNAEMYEYAIKPVIRHQKPLNPFSRDTKKQKWLDTDVTISPVSDQYKALVDYFVGP